MQAPNLGTGYVGACGVLGIGQIDDARALGDRCDHSVDRGPEIVVRHRNHVGVVGMGVVRDLQVAVGTADQFGAGPEIGASQPRQQVVGPLPRRDPAFLQAEPFRDRRGQGAVGVFQIPLQPGDSRPRRCRRQRARPVHAFVRVQQDRGRKSRVIGIGDHVRPNSVDPGFCARSDHLVLRSRELPYHMNNRYLQFTFVNIMIESCADRSATRRRKLTDA